MRFLIVLSALILSSACSENGDIPQLGSESSSNDLPMRLEFGHETCGRLQNETIGLYGQPWDITTEIHFRHFYYNGTHEEFVDGSPDNGLHFFYSVIRDNETECFSNVPWDINPIMIPGVSPP